MKTAIIGAGAMGSIYACLLAEAGHDVIAVTRNSLHREAIARSGLRVEGASGDRTIAIRTSESIPDSPVDLIILAVKAGDAESAAASLGPLITKDTVVLALQNGLGSAGKVARQVGGDRLIVGIAGGFGASMVAPGHVHHSGMQKILIGPWGGVSSASCQRIASTLQLAGFNAAVVDNILAMQWEKLICNVTFSALSALTGYTVGEIYHDAALYPVGLLAAKEAFETARTLQIPLSISDPVNHVESFAAGVMSAKPSMLADHEASRRSEIAFINGAVPTEAARAGLTAPVNQTLTALVMQRESQFETTGNR